MNTALNYENFTKAHENVSYTKNLLECICMLSKMNKAFNDGQIKEVQKCILKMEETQSLLQLENLVIKDEV